MFYSCTGYKHTYCTGIKQRNLLIFGFHLDFLEINQGGNHSYAAFSADCSVCIDILIESETLGSQSRLTKEKQTLSETRTHCQYFMLVLHFRSKRATSIESKCRPKGFGTQARASVLIQRLPWGHELCPVCMPIQRRKFHE